MSACTWFFFNDTVTTEIYTLSLHDALPISVHLVCHDVNETVRQLIHSGAVDFTIPQDLTRQGHAPLLLLRDHLRKKKPLESGQFQGQINILCMENLEGQ